MECALKKIAVALGAVLVLFSCTTKDGKPLGGEFKVGNVYVRSLNFDSARVFLDHRDTGKKTPALLQDVAAGEHVVHLFLSGKKAAEDSLVIGVLADQTDTLQFELNEVPSGDLKIKSNPDSARVLLNNLEFGITPLTIEGVPAGDYRLRIVKGSYDPLEKAITVTADDSLQFLFQLQEDIRRMVLLEHFSNTNCPPCPESDAIIDSLGRLYGDSQLVIIGYHASFPSPFDPLYQAAKTDIDQRMQYYQPPSIPRAYVDGTVVNDPLDAANYRTLIEQQLQQDTVATLAFLEVNKTAADLSGKLEIAALQDVSGAVLHIVLLEDEIDFENPPGTNGQKHFEAVFRAFYPSAQGQALAISAGDNRQFGFSFSLQAEYGNDLTVAAFIQDSGSGQILQAAWTRYPEF